MLRRKTWTFATLIVALITVAGCASRSAISSGETMQVQIEVDNNLRGITGISVYLLSDTGARRSLGPVESNRRAVYERTLRAGDYQLVATRVGQEDLVSERFRIDENVVVIWSLAQNQITFGTR